METKERYLDYEIMTLGMEILKTEVEKCLIEGNEDYLNELFLYGCWANESELVNSDGDTISKGISLLHRESFSIFDAIKKYYSVKIIKKFLDGGTDPNLKNNASFTALMLAAYNGNTPAVQELLKRPDIDPNLQDNAGFTALMYAARWGHSQAIQKLLSHPDIDPNLQDNEGYTALMEAARWGHTQAVQELLKHPKIKPNLQDNKGQTALMKAAINGRTQAVQELLKHPDTNPNLKNKWGDTALMLAAEYGNSQAVQELLSHPAIDITIINKNGQTAWDRASDEIRKQFPELNPIQRIKSLLLDIETKKNKNKNIINQILSLLTIYDK